MDFSEEINEAYSIKKAPGEIFQINSGYKKKVNWDWVHLQESIRSLKHCLFEENWAAADVNLISSSSFLRQSVSRNVVNTIKKISASQMIINSFLSPV